MTKEPVAVWPVTVVVLISAKKEFCEPLSVLWNAPAVTGKFVELVAPVMTTSSSVVLEEFKTAIDGEHRCGDPQILEVGHGESFRVCRC